jgi:hypothetical protein
MRDKCFDEGMIQAFFDGELDSGLLEQVARHVSGCEPCAFLMSEIEAESASVAAAFEIENFELVPTERLRTKIFTEIAEFETGGASWLSKAAAALGFSRGFRWTSPSVAAFASLVLVVGVVAVLLTSRPEVTTQPVAQISPKIAPAEKTLPGIPQAEPKSALPAGEISERAPIETAIARKAVYVEPRANDADRVIAREPVAESQPLQGEERYLQTIKTLKGSVDTHKEETLKPSALVSYERDMAVIDDAISKMQKAARKNPKDEAARQVLFSSYQNKIDLLSAVSDKTELMASLR